VVNASNTEKIAAWARDHVLPATTLTDVSAETALVAVQGPRSRELLEGCRTIGPLAARLGKLPYYWFVRGDVGGKTMIVSRTGYTGEVGFEVFVPPECAGDLWDELLERGRALGCGPVGLGARDTLRFEVCFCLYGHELLEDVSPLEAGIGWTVKLKKSRFIGKDALVREKADGLRRQLVGFEIRSEERAIARQGCELRASGRRAGVVTSGTFAPTLERGLAPAPADTEAAGSPLAAVTRGREIPVERRPLPFHKPVARD